MAISSEARDQLAARFEVLLPHLNERQQRLALATEARSLGHGGVRGERGKPWELRCGHQLIIRCVRCRGVGEAVGVCCVSR